jgi:hypothetical protein
MKVAIQVCLVHCVLQRLRHVRSFKTVSGHNILWVKGKKGKAVPVLN